MNSTALAEILTPQSDLLSNEQAAEYLGVTPGTLEVWRCNGRYELPFIKVGRLVKYRRRDLEAWLEARTHGNGVKGGE